MYFENTSIKRTSDTSWDTIREVFAARAKEELYMNFRNPWFNMMYNYIIVLCVIVLAVALFWWAVDIHYQRKADAQEAIAIASYQAAEQAKADAAEEQRILAEQSEEAVVDKMSDALAKLFYGADKFKTKYHYSDADFYTLARCVFNRVENAAYSGNFYEVIDQEGQWTGYYSTNPVLQEYKDLALTAIREWRSETVKPISIDYLWAEYTPNGIFLKNDFHADGYATRWRYGR